MDYDAKYTYIEKEGLDFDYVRKMSSRIVLNKNKEKFIYSKGSIDSIYDRLVENDKQELKRIEKIISDQYPDLRLLALAYKMIDSENDTGLETNLSLCGIVAIRDTIQENVPETISYLRNFGISCSVCTGDRKETAIAVAKEAGIICNNMFTEFKKEYLSTDFDKVIVFNGRDIDSNNSSFKSSIINHCGFVGYNMTPEDKQTITKILSEKYKCLTIGDGYNDIGMFNRGCISVSIKGNALLSLLLSILSVNFRIFVHYSTILSIVTTKIQS